MKDDKELSSKDIAKGIADLKYRHNRALIIECIERCLSGVNDAIGLSLIIQLRDEYEVRIIYDKNYLYMYDKKSNLFSAKFADKSQINRAVLECILESVK